MGHEYSLDDIDEVLVHSAPLAPAGQPGQPPDQKANQPDLVVGKQVTSIPHSRETFNARVEELNDIAFTSKRLTDYLWRNIHCRLNNSIN